MFLTFLWLALGRKLQCGGEKPAACRHCTVRNSECRYEPVQRRRGPGKAQKASRSKKIGHRLPTVNPEHELDALLPEIRPYISVLRTVIAK
jgi:hypothetical protein